MANFLPERRKIDASIDMTPLIDVVFQLLIFLMVSSHFTKPARQVELPAGSEGTATHTEKKKNNLLTITDENSLILNGLDITVEQFEETLKQQFEITGTKRLEIRGDTSSQLGTFIEIVETAKDLGVEGLSYHKKDSE